MSNIEERTVKMSFLNDEFKKGAAESGKALADLNKAVDDSGKSKGLLDMESQAGRVGIAFSKMAVISTTALATIANKVVNTGLEMAKAITIDPVAGGFREYEESLTKLNTIMNATGLSQKKVQGILQSLNRYSDKTIYSYADMTESVTKFVNAGVKLPVAAKSIQGISNAAAYAGASTQEAGRAMYAFSQAMGVGYIMLQDWNQIETANLGTVQFKNTLLESAVAAGELTRQGKKYVTSTGRVVTATEGWRDGLQDQWATVDVLNDALSKYTDKNTELGRKAIDSAKKVRTFTAYMDTFKESIESGWALVFRNLFGNLDDATKFWTDLSNATGNVVGGIFKWVNQSLKIWRKLDGFKNTLQGFKNIIAPIVAIFHVLGAAIDAAFPNSGKKFGNTLAFISKMFALITSPLALLAKLIRGATDPLATFFGIIRIGGAALKAAGAFLKEWGEKFLDFLTAKAPGAGEGLVGYLKEIGSAVSTAVKQINRLLDKGASLKEAFGKVSFDLPSVSGFKLPSLPSIGGIFGGGGDKGGSSASSTIKSLVGDTKSLTPQVTKLADASEELTKSGFMFNPDAKLDTSRVSDVSDKVGELRDYVTETSSASDTLGDKMKTAFGAIWSGILEFFGNIEGADIVSSLNLAILGSVGIQIGKFVKAIQSFGSGIAQLGQIGTGLGNFLEDIGKAEKKKASAEQIKALAIALLILAGAILVLSFVPADKLAKALAALTGAILLMKLGMDGMGDLVEKMDKKGVTPKLLALSVAIVAFAAAMLILSFALLVMNKVKWGSIAKGLVTMYALTKAMEKLGDSANPKSLLAAGFALGAIAVSMLLLAGALLLFKLIDWEDMAKGAVTLGAVALAVGLLAKMPAAALAKVGVSMLAASFGLESMARAMLVFGLVKWGSILKGIVVLAALTAALAILQAVGNPVAIAGVVGLALAMIGLAAAMMILNDVEWASIGKIAVILTVLLLAFAALMGIIYLAAPVIPLLIFFAVALAALGVAMAGFGVAFAAMTTLIAGGSAAFAALATGAAVAIATFLQVLAAEAPVMKESILKILQEMINGIVEAVPMFIRGFKDLWNAIKTELTDPKKKGDGKKASKSWVQSISDGIKEKLPLIIQKAKELVLRFIDGLIRNAPTISAKATELVAAVIEGISQRIDRVVTAGADLIIAFIEGISENQQRINEAAADAVIEFINGTAETIRTRGPELGEAMGNLGVAMVEGLIGGIGSMFGTAMSKIGELAEGMVNKAKSILKIFSPSRVFRDIGKFLVLGLTKGIQDHAASSITAVASMLSGSIAMADEMVSEFIQKLDQRALAARAKAEGLQAAANKAAKAAKQTKTKEDDKAAKKLKKRADAADKAADKAEKKAEKQKKKEQRQKEFEEASNAKRAEIKAKQAQNQLEAAKKAEKNAEALRVQANALEEQSKTKGLSEAERKKLRNQAKKLREQAKSEAQRANDLITAAKNASEKALEYQAKAGEEAAQSYQEQYDAAEKKAKDDAEFEKLSAAEKAKRRQEEADALKKKSEEDLKKAKELALTDIDAANALAEIALEEADRARQLADEAAGYRNQGGAGQVIDLNLSDAAKLAFAEYTDGYDAAVAAAAAGNQVNFHQYNTSPESLSDVTIYRQTNNLVQYAADKLQQPAA